MPRNRESERRTIDELALRYELHPELTDVYVEGIADKRFIEWFLANNNRRGWQVYAVATVEVPAPLVYARSLEVGERGEVLTLGMELSERLEDVPCRKPICIADSDFLAFDSSGIECDLCLLTDFTSMEMYAFNVKVLDKFLRVFVQIDSISSHELLAGMSSALNHLFVIRAVFHSWNKGIGIIDDFTRCCKKGQAEVQLDAQAVVTRSLQPTAAAHRLEVKIVLQEVERLLSATPNDVRRAIRGHVFVDMLAWFLDGYGVSAEIRNKKVVQRALLTSIEMNDLVEYQMFSELLDRTDANGEL